MCGERYSRSRNAGKILFIAVRIIGPDLPNGGSLPVTVTIIITEIHLQVQNTSKTHPKGLKYL
jgi:hypothetical protein